MDAPHGLQGMLMVPPDRSQILGRAVWKARYVDVSAVTPQDHPVPSSQTTKSTRSHSNKDNGKPKLQPVTGDYYITIYKSKDDSEPIQQYPVSSVTDAQVQMLSHRKQGPILPTLVVTITDKRRKRRSSRATGLMSGKDNSSASLWFRTPPDDHHPSLHDWANTILAKKDGAPGPADPGLISPTIFGAPSPFTWPRDGLDQFGILPSVVGGGNAGGGRMGLDHKGSTYTHSSKDPEGGHHTTTTGTSTTFSTDSPSIRSRKSDLSSPSHPATGASSNHTSALPGDASGGRSVPQGRLGAKGRGSVGSGPASPTLATAGSQEPGSPPVHRETILDRAFSMRFIPGSERTVPGEEKLTSLARFDALMTHVDERGGRGKVEARQVAARAPLSKETRFETDDSADDVDQEENPSEPGDGDDDMSDDEDDDDEDDEDDADDTETYSRPLIPPTAQRALEFIAGSREPSGASTSSRPRNPVSFYQPRPGPAASPVDRPHTSHTRSRPSIGQRSVSQEVTARPVRNGVEVASGDGGAGVGAAGDNNPGGSGPSRATTMANPIPSPNSGGDRQSTTSSTNNKRLSFTEFTKRLSSTSSLLLVQSNGGGLGNGSGSGGGGGGGSRVSSETDGTEQASPGSQARGAGPRPPPRNPARDERCGTWRSSVMGTEGGFL